MLVYRIFDGSKFVTDYLIASEKVLNEYVEKKAKLYRKENGEYYLWYDGEKWLFPKPDFNDAIKARTFNAEILSVLQEINSKLDNLN